MTTTSPPHANIFHLAEEKAPHLNPKRMIEPDSLTIMLVEMGFQQGPVMGAIQALGGPNRATPDTVIAWMLDHPQEEEQKT
jgi:hypothetical protein